MGGARHRGPCFGLVLVVSAAVFLRGGVTFVGAPASAVAADSVAVARLWRAVACASIRALTTLFGSAGVLVLAGGLRAMAGGLCRLALVAAVAVPGTAVAAVSGAALLAAP